MEQDPFPEKNTETSPGTLAGTRRKQKIMMEQSLFLGRIEHPIQLQSCLGNKKFGDDIANHRYPTVVESRLVYIPVYILQV